MMKLQILFLFLFSLTVIRGSLGNYIETNGLSEEEDDLPPIPASRNLDLDILDSDYFDEDEASIGIEPPIIQKKAPCLGCPNEISPNDIENNEKIQNIAKFAFMKFLEEPNYQLSNGDDSSTPIFVKIIKAQTQVVAGIKYILDVELGWSKNCSKEEQNADQCELDTTKDHRICTFHVVEKAWQKENSMEVVHTDCGDSEDSGIDGDIDSDDSDDEILVRRRRSTKKKSNANVGQPAELEVAADSERIMEIANFAIEQLDHFDEDDKARVLVDVINANKQTVSGWLFHLKIRIAQTTCKENTNATLASCANQIEGPYQKCEIKVLVQPWQVVQRKLVQSQCYPENVKVRKGKQQLGDNAIQRKKIGGPTILDPEDKSLQDIVDFAIESLDAQSNALHTMTPVRIVYAERQLASGIKTKLVVEVGYTNCRKSPALDRSQCTLDDTRDRQVCNITTLEKPWLSQKNIVSFACDRQEDTNLNNIENDPARTKRAIFFHRFEGNDVDEQSFVEFKSKWGKVYDTEEEHRYRFGVFRDNMKKAKLLQETEQGTATYGATQFADLTEEEFSRHYLGLRVDLKQRIKRKVAKIPILPKVPDEFDWRHYNAVTPVKNQGMCGSCWAFSVTGNIEGAYAIKHGNLESFSEQELVDCDKLDEGCNGGLPENAYKAIEKLGGLETESQYPYEGKAQKQCAIDSERIKAKVTNFFEVSKNETDMVNWLIKNGPISIGINANAMQFYFGGVSHPWKFLCSPKNLDHGVLIVGYGVHTYPMFNRTLPYWVVKNSWGENWGEQGYYRVYRGDGTCGVNQMATAASVE